jgi:hypothetical protein
LLGGSRHVDANLHGTVSQRDISLLFLHGFPQGFFFFFGNLLFADVHALQQKLKRFFVFVSIYLTLSHQSITNLLKGLKLMVTFSPGLSSPLEGRTSSTF